MIALVQIALPSDFLVPVGEALNILKLESETELEGVGQVEVFVHPPHRSKRSNLVRPGAILADPDAFNPMDDPPIEEGTVVEGDRAVIRCDAIAVELRTSFASRFWTTSAMTFR